MFGQSHAFGSFSVDDLDKAKAFYGGTLGLNVKEEPGMGLNVRLATGGQVFIYPKDDHEAASFTILNFPVQDIDEAVDGLKARGVEMERYDMGEDWPPDEQGIYRSDDPSKGPSIAWFKDPAGNVLSVVQ